MFFNNNKFILASTSKSRHKILKNCGLNFLTQKPNCNEDKTKKKLILEKKTAKKISLELARLKAKSICKKNKNNLVVGSDTIIYFNKKTLNKAKSMLKAKKTIKMLSGNTHTIYSSVSVYYNEKEVWNATEKTLVKIRSLKNEEIDLYLKKSGKKILFSVGCYQIEAFGPNIIEKIKGDFFNVMGFPLFPFLNFLKKFNIKK